MKRTIIILLCILALFSANVLAITGHIGSPRAILRPEVEEGQTKILERTLAVENLNEVDITVEILVDETFQDIATVHEDYTTIIMTPGEKVDVPYTLVIAEPYSRTGKLIVKFNPLEEDGPGIVLTSQIFIVGTKENPDLIEEETEPETIEGTQVESQSETEEAQANEETEEEEESSVSFGIKNRPDETQKRTIETQSKPNHLIGIGILVLIVFIGVVAFVIVTRMGGK